MVSITSDDILGKEAIDPEGQVLGIVMKLHIDKDQKKLLGITIDQGFMKPDLFIGMQYVQQFGVDAVILNRVPSDKLRGLEVLTSNGTHVGKVKEVLMKGARIDALVVSTGLTKEVTIPVSTTKEIGVRVILKRSVKPA